MIFFKSLWGYLLGRPRYDVAVSESSRGRWRVLVRDENGDAILMSCGRGWDTQQEAVRSARKMMRGWFLLRP